jgi:hypothetical protein
MKRLPLALAGLLAVALTCVTPAPAATSATPHAKGSPDPCLAKKSKWERGQCENFAHSAPADEYFGRMKMSYLGINNTFRDESIRAGDYTTDSGIINKVSFADEALQAWSAKYPGDPELARSFFLAIVMYKKIYTQPYQEKAWNYAHLLVAHFGSTYFGKVEKAEIAHGFTEHYFGNPEMCPTPLPSGVVAMEAPSATATPVPAPGQPIVNIITPPCVAPAPAPTLTP